MSCIKRIRHELRLYQVAQMFYSRLPVPSGFSHQPELLDQASRYLPAVGTLVALLAVALAAGLYFIQLPISLVAWLTLAFTVWLTGAFHEDGFADTCDGFGGGWTSEHILQIMKDSRIGTYGTVGLILALGARYLALQALLQLSFHYFAIALITAFTLSRWAVVNTIYSGNYARIDAASKVRPIAQGMSLLTYGIATVWTLSWLLLWQSSILFVCLPISIWLIQRGMYTYFHKKIRGYTGDCLGAIQQVSEIAIYLLLLCSHAYGIEANI